MVLMHGIRCLYSRCKPHGVNASLLRHLKHGTYASNSDFNWIGASSTCRNIHNDANNKDNAKPFRILGLQQVAIGSTDADAMKKLWIDILGLEKVGRYVSERENVAEDILNLGSETDGSVPVEVDLMCPLDENRSPKVHKPPLNHIGLWVDDLETAVDWMNANGVKFAPGGIRKGAAGHDVTFIHPKGDEEHPIGGCGVLIELVQAPEDVVEKLK